MLQKIKCLFGYHDLVYVRFLEGSKYKMVCKCCGVKKFMISNNILPWDADCDRLGQAFDLKCSLAEDMKKLDELKSMALAYAKARGIEIVQ